MKSDIDKLLKRHEHLNHSDNQKVTSHVQRKSHEWILNTVMIEGCSTPFKYKRKKVYKCLKGARVNITYYPDNENVVGFDLEVMRVVRIRVA